MVQRKSRTAEQTLLPSIECIKIMQQSVLHFVERWKAWWWRWCIFAFHRFASRWQHLPRKYCARTNTHTRALRFDRAWLRQTCWHANSINAKPQVAKAPATRVFQLHTCTQKWLPGRVPEAEQFLKAVVDLELVLGFRSSPSYRGWSDRFCGSVCGVSSWADEAVR